MRALISKSNVSGRVEAPSSKSYTLRGLMCAALADGDSEIVRPLEADDTTAAREVLGKIGARIESRPRSWVVSGNKFHQPDSELFCHDSAGTLRFMTAICALVPGTCRLTAGKSLGQRPVGPLVEALKQVGVDCSTRTGKAPVLVKGGRLKGGDIELPGDVSSQFISALLFIAPLAEDGMTISISSRPESKPYIAMTRDCMHHFGVAVGHNLDFTRMVILPQKYKSCRYIVEGDWSSASYLLAMGAVAGETHVTNLNPKSRQADGELWVLLNRMGAHIQPGHGSLTVRKSGLSALTADLSDCIDLLPTLAALAAVAEGTSEFTGINRARIKESDRVAAMREGLERMGIKVKEEPDRLIIEGAVPQGAVIDSKGDHRVAMAFSILGMLAGDTIIEGAECVAKTYPDYWDTLKHLGGKVDLHE